MFFHDLIEVRAFPSVVQAAEIRELRDAPTSPATPDFVRGYLGFDDRSRHALETLARSLSSPNDRSSGGAFFLNGVFGSGKSHLLGIIALLGDGIAQDALRESHPHLSPLLDNIAPRFTIHFSLDEYAAARSSLEEIFWREVGREWTRRGFAVDELAFLQRDAQSSRGEMFAVFDEVLRAHGFSSWLVCVDELSLFLSGREHRALQQDASWLQFLGQRARRETMPRETSNDASNGETSSTRCGFHIVAALQKTVEDIGDIDAYALSQIRDRFVTLPLSLAHLPSLIERRLVMRRDATKIAQICDETYAQTLSALPHLDFGRDEWRRSFPWHPATIALLETLSSRFGSRTRSAVVFCQGIDLQRDARQRVLTDELFDFFQPEMHTYPDLKPLVAMWQSWPETERDLARDKAEAQLLRKIMKALLLYKIAGIAPTVAQIANALLLDARLPGDGNYEYARVLLERMRVQSGGLAMEKRDGIFADRYTLDSGARIGELARRGVANALQTLPQGDSRVAAYALSCSRAPEMPLATLHNALSIETLWHHTPRRVRIALQNVPPSPQNIANLLTTLAARGEENDAVLFLVAPFYKAENLAEKWRENLQSALHLVQAADETSSEKTNIEYSMSRDETTRWRGAVAWWIARDATPAEWDEAREATAQHLLLQDPQLGDNRRGRAVLEHLRERLGEREDALSRLCSRLMREGTLGNGAGHNLDASDLALGESWSASLEAIASWILPAVFPRFQSVAPRLRVLAPATIDALCLETLRRPHDTPFYAASQERNVRAIAQPLGVAHESGGRWKMSPVNDEIAQFISTQIARNDGALPLSHLEATLRKSDWGLNEGQTRFAVCALIRSGALSACDARGQILAPNQIGLPLSRGLHHLRVGQLLDLESWTRLQQIVRILTDENLREVSFEEQERARQIVENWRDENRAATELTQARLHQLKKKLNADGAVWDKALNVLQRVGAALSRLSREETTMQTLSQVASWPPDEWQNLTREHRVLVEKLEAHQAQWIEFFAFLAHDELSVPDDLRATRAQLLVRFDNALDDEKLIDDARNWRDEYAKFYGQWHAAQNAPERWTALRRLENSDDWRAAQRLAQIATRRFGDIAQIERALNEERAKMCRFDGSLRGEPFCANCRLKIGERVKLRDPQGLTSEIEKALQAFRAALNEDAAQSFLSRTENGVALMQWREAGEDAALLSLLDAEMLQVIEEAFRPRRSVTRSLETLRTSTRSCRTCREWHDALTLWLDGDDNLGDDDEIEIED